MQFEKGLAARGAVQSGDLGFGLDQADYQHSEVALPPSGSCMRR
jgi:hypothetical protein